jgi:nucleotidyltransferase/DNA polymerase involved in DNA repair
MSYRPPAEMLAACVRIPGFEIQVERGRDPELSGVPLALLSSEQRPVVTACSPEARAAGIRGGMPLREVTATAPEVVLRAADPYLYAETFSRTASGLETVSPLVEVCEPGTAFLGLDGLVASDEKMGIYRSEAELVAALEAAIPPAFAVRIGIGRGKFTAWAAARTGAAAGAAVSPTGRTCRVADSRREEFLRPLPVRLLPLGGEMRRRLELFGIRTLGELRELPLSALLAQFGPEGRRAGRLARGWDDEPIRPRELPCEIVEALQFPAPEATLEAVLVAARELLERALRRPERRTRGVRQLRLDSLGESGRVWTQTITVRQPGTQAPVLFPPIRYRLERVRPPEAVEALSLALTAFTPYLGGQQALFLEPDRERHAHLEEEVRQLHARLGRACVAHIVGLEPWSRIPERRHQLVRYEP